MSPTEPTQAQQEIVREPGRGVRRMRLREFQAQLVERMRVASSGAEAQTGRLGVLAGGARWLIDLRDAGEVVAPGAITEVPLTHDWFLGLTNVRGNLVSVIDFARFQGHSASAIDKDCRIVVLASALGLHSGLLVSRVLGLRDVGQMEQQSAGGDLAMPWIGHTYVDHEAQAWNELDLSLLARDERFLQVGL